MTEQKHTHYEKDVTVTNTGAPLGANIANERLAGERLVGDVRRDQATVIAG